MRTLFGANALCALAFAAAWFLITGAPLGKVGFLLVFAAYCLVDAAGWVSRRLRTSWEVR